MLWRDTMNDQRRFNQKQRQALFMVSGGKCEMCGEELGDAWHADHVIPCSLGGQTDVSNGQALCASCNLSKGDSVEGIIDPYAWQQEALIKYWDKESRDFLCVACPGSGKTRWALMVARRALGRHVERIVIVVPTENLKAQWSQEAHGMGIELDPSWTSDPSRSEGKDFAGVVVTYQQVAMNPYAFAAHCSRRKTMFIADEIHHAAEGRDWGRSLVTAFNSATMRLCLSGTPWREDAGDIPFVEYEDAVTDDGGAGRKCKADYAFGYDEALSAGTCRPVLFHHFDGEMTWRQHGESHTSRLADGDADLSRKTLLTALQVDVEFAFLPNLLREAHEQLMKIRAGDTPDAMGLVTAVDQQHARAIAGAMRRHLGVTPVVVVSDDAEAGAKIDRLRRGNEPWCVSVRMVSEGTDIKRTRVLVYATNILTEMFFRQFMGRAVRGGDGVAHFYMPSDSTLVRFADRVKDEVARAIGADEVARRALRGETPRAATGGDFVPVGATEAEHAGTIFDGQRFTSDEIAAAEALMARVGEIRSPVDMALAIRLHGAFVDRTDAQPERTPTMAERRDASNRALNKLVKRYAVRFHKSGGVVDYRAAWARVNKIGGEYNNNPSIDELENRMRVVSSWLRGDAVAI